jgi:hypothetical protein
MNRLFRANSFIATLGLLLLWAPASGNAAVEQARVAPEMALSERAACHAGLRFGLTPDAIPSECHAHLVDIRTTDTDRKEKWVYSGGYLIFSHGALIAIQRSD